MIYIDLHDLWWFTHIYIYIHKRLRGHSPCHIALLNNQKVTDLLNRFHSWIGVDKIEGWAVAGYIYISIYSAMGMGSNSTSKYQDGIELCIWTHPRAHTHQLVWSMKYEVGRTIKRPSRIPKTMGIGLQPFRIEIANAGLLMLPFGWL